MSAFGPLRHFAATQPFGRYRINNGQTAPLGLTGSAAFDVVDGARSRHRSAIG
jgi:hypothetical protein